ncbi:MAG TPA: DUF1127 domain-containing protein [Methylomirabilota bacterium]|nr:DUF1127 domain-containing protein [Methylomirabilota bacterium]
MDIKTVPLARGELARAMSKAASFVHAYREARLERTQLLTMSDRELRDIGMSRIDALRAAAKPLWQFPPPVHSAG